MTNLGTDRRIPSLYEVIQAGIDASTADFYSAIPGIVQKYDETARTVDVLPAVARTTFSDRGEIISDPLAVLADVPVMFLSGGGCFVQFPLVKGDMVLLVFSDSSLDEFKAGKGGDQVVPKIARLHDISDAVAITGFFTRQKKYRSSVGKDMVLGKENKTQMRIADDEVQVVSEARPASLGGPVAMAQKCDALWDALMTILAPGGVPIVSTVTDSFGYLNALAVAMNAIRIITPNVESTNLKAD